MQTKQWTRINLQNIQAAYTAQYQKANNPIKNGRRPIRHLCLNRHLFKDIQMANKQVKRCSTSLITREMQIKNINIMRHHFTQVRMAIINLQRINAGEGMEKREPPCPILVSVKVDNHSGKQYGGFLKNETFSYHMTQQCHSWVYTQENHNSNNTCSPMFTAALFTRARTWKQPNLTASDSE